MCGIAGVFRATGPIRSLDVAAVERMLLVQASRGPDGSGLQREEHAALGHRRLSIIDLSEAGRQPMANEDGTVWLTYNGEIYNHPDLRDELVSLGHRFRSSADSEVVVHGYEAWGIDDLVDRLRGMYAFALLDTRRDRLLLVRDRLGIKPLYYTPTAAGESIAFASEVRALVASGVVTAADDPAALVGFLALGSIPAPRTVVEGISSVPAGHYLEADARGSRLRRYWRLPPVGGASESTGWEARVRTTLEDAVARHLVSDVPLGVFLSRGVDSAALVAVASQAGHRLHTLTIAFDEPEWDEAPQARRVAARYRSAHDEVLVTHADFLDELPSFVAAVDQPTHDGLNTYFVARAARKAGLTVVLSGAGGDEAFWGYPHYRRLSAGGGLVRGLAGLPGWARRLATGGTSAVGRLWGRDGWGRVEYLSSRVSPEGLYLAVRGFFSPRQIAMLLDADQGEVRRSAEEVVVEGVDPDRSGSLADAVNRIEFHRYLHDQLLRDTDVFGMAHSVEVRVPYLDHELIEAVVTLPDAVKLDPALNKPVLCRAARDATVVELAGRPKRGFSFPMDSWMRRHAAVLEAHVRAARGLNPRAVARLWRAFRSGRLHWSRAWALVVLGARGRPVGADA
jgi:asparagine synthase (glutamine-hydrolysing)